jgi:glutaredoxin-related protein
MGGYPPIDGPYAEMLQVTAAAHRMSEEADAVPTDSRTDSRSDGTDWSSVEVTTSERQTRQFMTLYTALQTFDDRAAQQHVTCPRLCFVGSADEIEYGERWGGVQVSMAGPLVRRRAELEAHGWEVHVLDGLDHTGAMQAKPVLPILRPWLAGVRPAVPVRGE